MWYHLSDMRWYYATSHVVGTTDMRLHPLVSHVAHHCPNYGQNDATSMAGAWNVSRQWYCVITLIGISCITYHYTRHAIIPDSIPCGMTCDSAMR